MLKLVLPTALIAQAVAGSSPPLSLTVVLGLTCCAVGLVAGVLVLGLYVARRRGADERAGHVKRPGDS